MKQIKVSKANKVRTTGAEAAVSANFPHSRAEIGKDFVRAYRAVLSAGKAE